MPTRPLLGFSFGARCRVIRIIEGVGLILQPVECLRIQLIILTVEYLQITRFGFGAQTLLPDSVDLNRLYLNERLSMASYPDGVSGFVYRFNQVVTLGSELWERNNSHCFTSASFLADITSQNLPKLLQLFARKRALRNGNV